MADFTSQRQAVRTADAALAQALYQKTVAPSAANQAALTSAQQTARANRDALNTALAASISASADSASNLQGNLPIALFPVRLETRYVRATTAAGPVGVPSAGPSGTLQIRVYPDDILAQTHEPELTDDEWQAGRAYWTAGDTAASWSALLARFTVPRAAWIVSKSDTAVRPPARAASWTRPGTAVLPDNFAAFAFRGGAVVSTMVGLPIPEPLTLTMSPVLDAAQRVAIAGSSLQIDSDLLWTVQFAAAKAAGMGLELPVTAADWALGFDLLLVVGTKGTFSPAEASQQIQTLLDGHHYTRGLALVAPGTPTSNLPGAPAGYPLPDSRGASSFAIERGTPSAGDGLLAASALGIGASVITHLDQTGLQTDATAQAMLTALWPATLGYQLEQMMAPADATLPAPFDANAIAAAYNYTRTNVRPAGPLPAFRVGAVPYGLLPATSVMRLAAAFPSPIATALNLLHGNLLTASDQAARINPSSSDPDGDLINVLRLNANSLSFQVQVLIGSQLQARLAALPGLNGATIFSTQANQAAVASALLRSAGLPSANPPRIAQASFGLMENFRGVLVSSLADRQSPLPDSENYIKWIIAELASGAADLAADSLPAAYERTLLYQLLRHAVLVEKARAARPGLREAEVLGLVEEISSVSLKDTTLEATKDTTEETKKDTTSDLHLSTSGTATESTEALGTSPPTTTPPPSPVPHLADVTAALTTLASLSIADLERLFSETLDLCSHRFDAWITSLATARLKDLRSGAGGQGTHLGAFGWVQNLKPAASPFDPGTGGFIHAPSPNHAQAAAILRNGYMARGAPGSVPYAVDLSSSKVRAGLAILERIRDGESLSEILGTEVETRLRASVTLATTFLEALRIAYPTPSSTIVDGLAAVLAWRANPASPKFPSAIFSDVSQLLDAAADLLTAESIYQMVRGNPAGAVAGLDALGQGVRPPEPEVAHAPIAGTTLSHRVAVILDDSQAPGWTSAPTPRSSACRYIDGWLGQLLGDPARVKCRATTAAGVRLISLAQLALRPIDVIALSAAPLDGNSEIDQRIRDVAGDPAATVDFTADPSLGAGAVTFATLFELAQTTDRLISLARPLVASDLATPSDTIVDAPDADVAARAKDALQALTALDLTTAATQRAQLRQAALFGFGGAYVADNATAADLAATAQRIDAQRQARVRQAATATDPAEIIRCVFARSLPMAGHFALPTAVPPAMAGPAGLTNADVSRWMHKAARVQPGLDRWRRTRLFTDALGAPSAGFEVVQLPYSPTATWCALPFPNGGVPPSGTVSIAIHRPWKTAASGNWAGLLLAEWSELVPSAVQQTGIALNYPSPRAEAPQAVLLAVPPADTRVWSTVVLVDIVREAFELSRIRLLIPDHLSSYSLLLPSTSLTVNSGGDDLSTNLWKFVGERIQWVPVSGELK